MNIHSIFSISTLLLGLTLISCNSEQSKEKAVSQKKDSVVNVYRKPPSGFTDTLIVASKAAIFYNPDSVQLERLMTLNGKVVYENTVHDCFYQMRNARMELKQYWPQIKKIEFSRIRYLIFIKSNKEKIVFDLDKKGDMCGIFLFDPKKNPQLIDMMNIDTELNFYFNNP